MRSKLKRCNEQSRLMVLGEYLSRTSHTKMSVGYGHTSLSLLIIATVLLFTNHGSSHGFESKTVVLLILSNNLKGTFFSDRNRGVTVTVTVNRNRETVKP